MVGSAVGTSEEYELRGPSALPKFISPSSLCTGIGSVDQPHTILDDCFDGVPWRLSAKATESTFQYSTPAVPLDIAAIWKAPAGERDQRAAAGSSDFPSGLPHYTQNSFYMHSPVDQVGMPQGNMPGIWGMDIPYPHFLAPNVEAVGLYRNNGSSIPSEGSAAAAGGDASEDEAELVDEPQLKKKSMKNLSTTTLMVQNIPRQLTRQKIMEAIEGDGFGGYYDYCYVPRCFESNMNKGYAFVNFVSEDAANTFKKSWDRTFKLGTFQRHRPKPIRVTPAALQGYARNSSFAASKKICRIRNGEYRPLVCN